MSELDVLAAELDELLAPADTDLTKAFPGNQEGRQPVHTVYVPADRYHPGTVTTWGRQARGVLEGQVRSATEFAEAFGIAPVLADEVYDRVHAKRAHEPIEDLRIDFEDGYGNRSDQEEDSAAVTAAGALTESLSDGTASPYVGIRFKSFEAPTRPLRRRARAPTWPSRRVRGDPAEGHLGRTGRSDGTRGHPNRGGEWASARPTPI